MKKRRYGDWAGNPEGIPEDKTLCIQNVYGQSDYHGHQCCRKRGHGKDGLYCKQHNPKRIAKERKERDDDLQEKYEKSEAVWKRREILVKMADSIKTDDLKNYKLVKMDV